MSAGMTYLKNQWLLGLLAAWRLDDTPNDGAFGLHNCTLNGSPGYAAGKYNNCLVLDGTSQDMQTPWAADLGVNAWTVSAWCNLDANASGRTNGILGTRFPDPFADDNTFDIKIHGGNGTIHADIGDGSSWITTNADVDYAFTPGVWYMVTMAVGNGRYDYYVNGGIVGGNAFAGTPLLMKSPQEMHVGQCNRDGGEWFSGSLDEVYLWNRVLSATEIANLYAAIRV